MLKVHDSRNSRKIQEIRQKCVNFGPKSSQEVQQFSQTESARLRLLETLSLNKVFQKFPKVPVMGGGPLTPIFVSFLLNLLNELPKRLLCTTSNYLLDPEGIFDRPPLSYKRAFE